MKSHPRMTQRDNNDRGRNATSPPYADPARRWWNRPMDLTTARERIPGRLVGSPPWLKSHDTEIGCVIKRLSILTDVPGRGRVGMSGRNGTSHIMGFPFQTKLVSHNPEHGPSCRGQLVKTPPFAIYTPRAVPPRTIRGR